MITADLTYPANACCSRIQICMLGGLQGYGVEPQRAESPPTPAVPPISYFLTKEPVVTSYITPLPQPVPLPGPPVLTPMQQSFTVQGEK